MNTRHASKRPARPIEATQVRSRARGGLLLLVTGVFLWAGHAGADSPGATGRQAGQEDIGAAIELTSTGYDLEREHAEGALFEGGLAGPADVDSFEQERVSVLVHLAPAARKNTSQAHVYRAEVRTFAAMVGGYVRYEYDILPHVVNLRGIPRSDLNELRNLPGVVAVEQDYRVRASLNDSIPLIGALQPLPYPADGNGIRICVCDTGIDSDHMMYQERIDSAAGWDFVNADSSPEDDNGHGSHVAGIALGGLGIVVDFGCVGPEPFQGVAPKATLIGVKVLDAVGNGYASDTISGIEHCASVDLPGGRADVINLSLGSGAYSGVCDTDSVALAANNAVHDGIVVVAAAGNEGNMNALLSPACGSQVIAVGATYDDSYPSCEFPTLDCFPFDICMDCYPPVDAIACFSNWSANLDVVAPGCLIFSAFNDPGGDVIMGAGGTSQAAPHVAGLAALILDLRACLSPADVREIIRAGAVDLGPSGFDKGYGYGRIDVLQSLELAETGACSIDGVCYVDGDTNPDNDCAQCDVAGDPYNWSPKEVGTPCGNQIAEGACDNPDKCDGAGNCGPAYEPVSTECRPTAGDCDVAEFCTGSSPHCPGDALRPGTEECRPSAGECDPAEFCDAVNKSCPEDLKSTAECRVWAGVCDPAEFCDGVSNDCPEDVKSTDVCRPAADACDAPDYCDGENSDCPPDEPAAVDTVCRGSAGLCDVAEVCDGVSIQCPVDELAPPTFECRPAAGACDLAEFCDGVDGACPEDSKSTDECRVSVGICDPAEFCDGFNNDCPEDVKSTDVCRPAADTCDAPEYCDGENSDCPTDVLAAADTECRAPAGPCDVAEVCDGVSIECPEDGFRPPVVECRASVNECDIAEFCTGTSPDCPPDAGVANGTPCTDDGNLCTDDVCAEAECAHPGNSAPCDDGDPCNVGEGCQEGICTGGGPPDCSGVGGQCRTATCDPGGPEGNCDTLTNVWNGSPCNDGDSCNVGEACQDGSCTGGGRPDCSWAGDSCNTASCDPGGTEGNCDVLTPVANGAECNDDEFCNGVETCKDGECQSSGDPCIGQGFTCSERNRKCVECFEATDCDDNDPCTADACIDSICVHTVRDEDHDGVCDLDDCCPGTSSGQEVDSDGCSCHQLDSDLDGVNNCDDTCPDTPVREPVDADGCSSSQHDGDGDGVSDVGDNCPNVANGADLGTCTTGKTGTCLTDEDCDTSTGAGDGFCAMDQEDEDGDGYGDACDDCPNTPADSEVQGDGCRWFVLIIELGEEAGQPSPMKEGVETMVEAPAGPEGFRFDCWEGDVPAGHEFDNPLQIVMDSNKSLAAVFVEVGDVVDGTTMCGAGAGCRPDAPAVVLILFGLIGLRFVGPQRNQGFRRKGRDR